MSESHVYYLSLGSNIEPQANLHKAIEMLGKHGRVEAMSNAWESRAAGSGGPNFLNASLSFRTAVQKEAMKTEVIRPIESALGRVRSEDKNAPRPIDIDMLIADGEVINSSRWAFPYVIVPMSELLPEFSHPLTNQRLAETAQVVQAETWIVKRPDILQAAQSSSRR